MQSAYGGILLAALALPWLAAAVLCALPRLSRNASALCAGLSTLAALALLGALAPAMFAGEVAAVSWHWLPLAGADFGLRADGLAWTFGMLALSIGALVVLYARYYLDERDPMARFFAGFMGFMGAMLGMVLADNLLLLVVFWELTSLASFLLIGYWSHREDARRGARMALTVTALGGLALLAGVLLIGHITGSLKIDAVLAAGEQIRAHGLYDVALLLVLTGVFAKSAQFPLHFWLPQAMAAPTPVSAYLHSATLVKAGLFVLARLHPALAGTDLWFYAVSLVGLATLLAGAYLAVFQHDLKGLLAYSTISHLGLITLLFGMGTPLAAVAAVFHLLNHATFKASLFMAAGIIDHEAGSRDMRKLNGLWRRMPFTAALAILAAAAMAGVPLMNGFLSKEMFFEETLALERHGAMQMAVPLVAGLAAAFSVAYSLRFIHDVFWNGEPRGLERTPHDPPFWMLVPVAALALLCLVVGVMPAAVMGPVLALAAGPVVGGSLPAYSLAVWHGVNLPFVMSLVALGAGALMYFALQRLYRLHDRVHLPRGGREVFHFLMDAAVASARAWSATARRTGLQFSVRAMLIAALLAGVWPWLVMQTGDVPAVGQPAPLLAWVLWGTGLLALAALLRRHRERLESLIYLGVVGLVVSMTFGALSAPDLLLTQLLVEVASILLLLLALRFLPAHSAPTGSGARRWRDGVVAGAAGLGVGWLAWRVMTRPVSDSIAPWFLENALPGAAGANAVNVIIVDFRAFDTLGEITVLALAALLVAALLPRGIAASPPADDADRSPLLEQSARWMLPMSAVVALWFFLRGHNQPGGGFIGGLMLAIGLLLPYLARGTAWTEGRLRMRHENWIALGVACAALTGVASLLLGYPFLTSAYVPPVASALFFDLGVFVTVTGATLLILTRLGRVRRADLGSEGAP